MDFNRTVTDPNGLRTTFGAAESRVAFEMSTDGVASSIPGIGMKPDVANEATFGADHSPSMLS